MFVTEDNNGGTTYAEFFANGYAVDRSEVIAKTCKDGNFYPTIATTPTGALAMTSGCYAQVYAVAVDSPFQLSAPVPQPTPGPHIPEELDTSDFAKALSKIYVWSLGIAALLAMLMVVVGGYLVMTARGNAQQAAKGKEYITSALIGMVILLAAYLILNTINNDLVDFEVPSLNLIG
jgi:hypothetical protein